MNEWETLERALRDRGVDARELDVLRKQLQPIIVHSNSGVVASSISGPIAIGSGAKAGVFEKQAKRAPPADERTNAPGEAPAPSPTTSAKAGEAAKATGHFWKQAGEVAKEACSATIAISKIADLASKFL